MVTQEVKVALPCHKTAMQIGNRSFLYPRDQLLSFEGYRNPTTANISELFSEAPIYRAI